MKEISRDANIGLAINHIHAAHDLCFGLRDHFYSDESLDIAMEGLEQALYRLRKLKR
jgi:hypothetical protein